MNYYPKLTVISHERGNGIVYGLEWGLQGRSGPIYFPAIKGFLKDPLTQGEKGFEPFRMGLEGMQDFENISGYSGFDPTIMGMNLRDEFCDKGYAYPPKNDNGTRLRAYMLFWNERTLIHLGGLIKIIPRGSKSGAWQDYPDLQQKISPYIDILYAIEDGLSHDLPGGPDFCAHPEKAGFFDSEKFELMETVELKRYEQNGKRLKCDRDST